nr:MAG TPA: YopX protein [Caudoviricetes sp.]
MREIKFRAWVKEKKAIFEVILIDYVTKKVTYLLERVGHLLSIRDAKFNDVELMQYTGLKDKNEKEIYEGDIFHIGSKKILYVVEWIDCGLKGRQIKNKSWIGLDYWKDDIEVIGNIYENPEVIKEVRQ